MNIAATVNNLRQMPPEQLFAQATRVLPPWVALALVIALAWQLAQLTWLVFPRADLEPLQLAMAPVGPVSPVPAAGGDLLRDVESIVAAHLFDRYQDQPVPEVIKRDDVPETTLNLKLLGTVATDVEEQSLAIIVDERGNAGVYQLGDPITQGVSLEAVYPTEVLLKRSGKLEKLELPQAGETGGTPSRRTSRASRSDAAARSATARLSEALAANPQKLTDLIRPQPVFANGRQLGYRVYPGRNRQDFVQLGLKPGDLVTQINGTPLDDPSKGLEIFRALEEATQVSVTVERNGESQVLVLDTDVLQALGER